MDPTEQKDEVVMSGQFRTLAMFFSYDGSFTLHPCESLGRSVGCSVELA